MAGVDMMSSSDELVTNVNKSCLLKKILSTGT
jgi:hypothetical protein